MPFKIYRSSAGSGKTFTLVKEYLRLSLSSSRADGYRNILAITFTNKAAEEMKSRVLEVLDAMARPKEKPHDMALVLGNELNMDQTELSNRAEKTLKHMLHHYSDISISTIDHFTHTLVRSFAQDLGLSVNFEVEMDPDKIANKTVSTLLEKVGTDRLLTRALINVVNAQIEDEKSWTVQKVLQKYAKALFNEETRFHLEKLQHIDLQTFDDLRKRIRSIVQENKQQMKKAADQLLQRLRQHDLGAKQLAYGQKGIHSYLNKISKGTFEQAKGNVLRSLNANKWWSAQADEQEKAIIEQLAPEFISLIHLVDELWPRTAYLQLIYDNLYRVALLDEMHRIQQQLQKEDEILHIGEFNHLVSKVVMNETAPFIYERIGHRYSHFLVDEFQDTSVLQWFNLLPLVEESLAHNNLCLVVGDAKQSIYRWRGGDVQQFIKLPEVHRTQYIEEKLTEDPVMERVMKERENTMHQHAELLHLDSNYRSWSNVVSFNNALFQQLQLNMPQQLALMYDQASQKITKNNEGLVRAAFFERPGAGNRKWEEYPELTKELILKWIHEVLADGFKHSDIAIILRRNKDAVEVAQFLIEKGIAVVSNQSLLINSSPKVRLLVNLAIWLTEPENAVNIVEMVQHIGLVRQEQQLTPSRMLAVGQDPANNIVDLLGQLYPSLRPDHLRQLSVYAQFEQLGHMVLGGMNDTYVNFFFDEILTYTERNHDGIIGFLNHWMEQRSEKSIALPEAGDAVRIMTIHKSKGLEFPVVIHPFADYPTDNRGTDVWSYIQDDQLKPLDRIRITTGTKLKDTPFEPHLDAELELRQMDMFNEMYVALTRAKARLYTCGEIKRGKEPKTAIQHIFQHVCTIDPSVEDRLTYTLGDRTRYQGEQKQLPHLDILTCGDPNWMDRIRIARPSKNKWKTQDENHARNIGILIHEALAHVRTEQDIPQAVKMLVEDGRLSEAESTAFEERIRALIGSEQLKPLFGTGLLIRNEADIQLADGQWIRPDRVVCSGNRAWVLDYKTGKQENEHLKQMNLYVNALHELGFTQVEGILLYINESTLVRV